MKIQEMIEALEKVAAEIGEDAPVVIKMRRPTATGHNEEFIFDTGSPGVVHPVYYLEEDSAMIGFGVAAHQGGELKISVREE